MVWIGLHQTSSGVWTWTQGGHLREDSSAWTEGQPNDAGANCADISSSPKYSKLNDWYCDKALSFVCQVPGF